MLTKQKLPLPALKKILKDYELGKVKKIKPMATSGNITFLIASNIGKFVLRLCPEGERWRSRQEILAELELIDYLLRNNFPIAKPVAKQNGKRIVSYKNKFGYLREYNTGKFILNPTIKQVERFGQLVGWFHSLIKEYKTKNPRNHIWDLEETKKHFQQSKKVILESNLRNKKEFIKRFGKELSLLRFPEDLPSGMIHEDLGKRHVLWKGEKIEAILDFDRCYYGKLVLDLGQACRGWCFTDNWTKWNSKNFKTLLRGYQNKRKLTNLEKEFLFGAIRFGVLERSLSFCLRFINMQDSADEDFAWHSLVQQIEILEENKENIS